MYRKFLLLSVAATLTCSIGFAKIWRVNNTAGITADFTTAQAAHDGAAAGDTIHLEPSLTDYGSLTTTKRLTWLSTGNFLTSHPGLQYAATSGKIANITVSAGSENSVFSCNSNSGFTCTASNVTFLRCYTATSYIYITGGTNCVIIDCYVNGTVYAWTGATNTIISNNIITSDINVDLTSSAVVSNNVIAVLNSGGENVINNSQFQNNIIDQASTPYTFTNSTVNNNIANNSSLPAGNGNQNNVTMSNVFVSYQGTTDGDFALKAGSPAIGTGFGGTNMGAFGGTTPFVLGLQPAVPAIYQLNAPAAPSGNTMNVTFSTKSNN
ncbi:MAG: hypothetical protein ABI707_15825 [Ferruginibacter sp.]